MSSAIMGPALLRAGAVIPFVSDGASNSGVVRQGVLCYMSTNGKVVDIQDGATVDTGTNFGRGLLGWSVGQPTTGGNQPVLISPILPGHWYELQSYNTAPTLALMAGASPYGLYIDTGGVAKIHLGNTTNGVALVRGFPFDDSQPLVTDVYGSKAPKVSGWAVGDKVYVEFVEAVRWFK